jgi:hypothetical protein
MPPEFEVVPRARLCPSRVVIASGWSAGERMHARQPTCPVSDARVTSAWGRALRPVAMQHAQGVVRPQRPHACHRMSTWTLLTRGHSDARKRVHACAPRRESANAIAPRVHASRRFAWSPSVRTSHAA